MFSYIKNIEKFTFISLISFILAIPFIIEVNSDYRFEISSSLSLFFLLITPILSFIGLFRSALKEKRETLLALIIFIISSLIISKFILSFGFGALVFSGM